MNNCETDTILRMKRKRALECLMRDLQSLRKKYKRQLDERKQLLKVVIEYCKNETVLQWLRENEESDTFSELVDMFQFWKKHIDEEEKKNHSDNVDITFVAHGSIRDFMIPASCLLPLPTITDVVLYSPWNCITAGDEYGIATGRIKHRVFSCRKGKGCTIPDEMHRPVELPDHWNSMKNAGGCKIPNITVSPLQPDEGILKYYELCTKIHGPPGRNRIFVPFILPEEESESVQFSVVMLALSLVLLSSRFKATVHLSTCLVDQSDGQKFDKEQLKKQYAYTIDNTVMTVSPDMLREACTIL